MKAKISKTIIVFSYLLFTFSLMILCINKAAAIIILTASFGTFLLGGLIRSQNDSPTQNCKKKK